MKKSKDILSEAMAIRYMDLAGIEHINEEIDQENIDALYQPKEDAHSGGENLHSDIDHVKVVSDEENVKGVEVMDLHTGEVEVTDIDIQKIAEAVKKIVAKENSN